MTDNELNLLIDSIKRKVPIQTSRDIENFEAWHRAKVKIEAGKYIARFEDYFDTLNSLVRAVNYAKKDGWPQSKTIQFL